MNGPAQKGLLAVVILSLAAGWVIWALSPAMTGRTEPWDGDNLYYLASLFFGGVLISLIAPRYFWVTPIGLFFGQLGFMVLKLPMSAWFVPGIIFLAAYTLIGLAGSALASFVYQSLRSA